MPPRSDVPQAPQTGTATLRGRVVALQTGSPLRRAQVSISLTDGRQLRRATTTDSEGRYEFLELPAGRFSVNVTKAGYVSLQYGQRRPFEAGTPVSVADGEAVERIDISLPRGSVIAARITDEFGEPIAGAMVQVQRYQYGPDGQRRLQSAGGGLSPFAATDDRGEFRAYGLMPGEYVVHATTRSIGGLSGSGASDSSEGFSPTYYPGTISSAEAQPVTVGVGDEVSVQFSMIAARLARVSGRVIDSEGRPAAGASLSIVTVTGTGMSSYGAGQSGADGSFTVSGVAPGEHTLRVTRTSAGTAGEFASLPIAVGNADLTGISVTLGAGATITGRVVFEGTSPRTGAPTALRVTASQADPQRQFALMGGPSNPLANGTVDDDGRFTLAGATGRVFFTLTPLPAWTIKSVSIADEDITDVPIDLSGRTTIADLRIVMTDKLTTIAGQVTDGPGRAIKDYVVVIQPAEQKEPIVAARWTRVVRSDTNGRFETRGMRPGRYIATAVEALEQGQQFAPEVQSRLRSGGRAFDVAEGASATLSLELAPGF